MLKKLILLLSVGLAALLPPATALAQNFPRPTGFVNDFANVIDEREQAALESKLVNYEKTTGNEISVATVSDLQGTAIEDYAVRLFESWKIGKKSKDNGVLLLVAVKEREVRIEVGYGLEGELNDSKAGRIIRGVIIPRFKEGNYTAGIANGTDAITKTLSGDQSAVPPENSDGGGLPIGVFVFGMIFLQYLAAFLGRSKEAWPGAVIGAVLGGIAGTIFLSSIIPGVILAVVFGIIGYVLDFILSKNYQERKDRGLPTTWWTSGGGFSSGSRSSGWGGFGGGRSGGGGASGRW